MSVDSSRSAAARVPASAAVAGMAVVLPRWQRWGLYAAVALLFFSGVAWLAGTYLLAVESQFGSMPGPLAPWALRVHGISAYGSLVMIGTVLPGHIRLAWLLHRNRITGAVLSAAFILLSVSGLWLYYGPEWWRDGVGLSHWIIGLALPAWLALHRWRGIRSRGVLRRRNPAH